MKFFFRKFLSFEATRGSAEGVELVKEKAAQFVASLIGEDEGEAEEQQDSGMEVENENAIDEEDNWTKNISLCHKHIW